MSREIEAFLEKNYENEIYTILKTPSIDELPFKSIAVNLSHLKKENLKLFEAVTNRMAIWKSERPKWVKSLNEVQRAMMIKSADSSMGDYYSVKPEFPISFVNLPDSSDFTPTFLDLWKFMQVKGSVVRMREPDLREVLREYKCRKCKKEQTFHANRFFDFAFQIPSTCPQIGCNGVIYNMENKTDNDVNLSLVVWCREITLQIYNKSTKSMHSLRIELEGEQMQSCSVGDRVTICGTLETRSKEKLSEGHQIVLRAAGVSGEENQLKTNIDRSEMELMTKMDYEQDLIDHNNDELTLRDKIVASVAPELEGLTIVKLGLLLVMCSGGKTQSSSQDGATKAQPAQREICHFLLIGDPGLGKSQLLKAAKEMSMNGVHTVGYAATTAGLTASCYKEDGDTVIEAGILVRANNGVCCIDEINLLTKEHRSSIHEVMESQKISFAKAGNKTDLHTKCSIIAGMNQRNCNLPIEAKNIALEQSLLSRFDLMYELEGQTVPEHEMRVIDHILNSGSNLIAPSFWSNDRLQAHIHVVKNIHVEINKAALQVLMQYYKFCRQDNDIDQSRNSARLWCSLERLTKCHAKLLMRTEASIIDAITVVVLMEASWSFGNLFGKIDVMSTRRPIGPSKSVIAVVLEKLYLEHLLDKKPKSPPKPRQTQVSQESLADRTLEEIFDDDDPMEAEVLDQIFSTQQIESLNNKGSSTQTTFPIQSMQLSDEIDESNFSEPPVTSTQLPQIKKRKVEDSPLVFSDNVFDDEPNSYVDPLQANLNSLAAFFANPQTKSDTLSSTKLESTSKTPKAINALERLKKFRCDDDSSEQTQNPVKENEESSARHSIQVTNEPSQSELLEMQRKLDEELDNFDIWG